LRPSSRAALVSRRPAVLRPSTGAHGFIRSRTSQFSRRFTAMPAGGHDRFTTFPNFSASTTPGSGDAPAKAAIPWTKPAGSDRKSS